MEPIAFQKLISRTLRGGVLVSALLLVLGIVGLFLSPSSLPSEGRAPSLAELLQAITSGASSIPFPVLLLYAGILVLAVTPLARVLITLLGFAVQKDWKFVALSLIVLLVITVSISLGAA